MIARNLREPDDLPHARARRYFAAENRVICQLQGNAYLVCTVEHQIFDGLSMAEVLADALNRNPLLTA